MNREEIEQWLIEYDIKNYTIHDDLVVDVGGGVSMSRKELTELPFQFGDVKGDFYCSYNRLTSLKNCPTSVGGGFACHSNNLTTLQYCPRYVGGGFWFSGNPFIVTEENENEWMGAIENNRLIYCIIKEPTEALTSFYKMLYEI